MGKRYVEVFRHKKSDYYNAIAGEVGQDGGEYMGFQTGQAAVMGAAQAQALAAGRGGEGGEGGVGMGAPRMAQPTLPGPMPKGEGLGSVMGGGFAKSREHTGVLKLRGLPFTTTKEVWGYEVGAGFFGNF